MKTVSYLDNASSSFPKPSGVIRAVTRALAKAGANPNRAGHALGRAASRIVFETREALAELLRLPNPERIIFTKNATEGINLALKGLLRRGDRVAISGVEHNAVIRPLTGLAKRGVKVEHAPLTAHGLPDPRRVPDVKLLVTVTGSNVTGALADIPRLAAACRKKGVTLMLDTAQTAGAVPSDFAAADIVAGTGHKALLGPQGTGFVWFRKVIEPEPLIEGGTGSFSESGSMPPFWPDRHEAGTLNTPGIAGLGAAIKYLMRRTVEDVRSHEVEILRAMLERLRNDERIITYPPFEPEARASLILFNARGMDPAALGAALDRRGVAARVGLHCAPEAHRFLGTFPAGGVRVSPGPFTTKRGVSRFFDALRRVLKGQ